MAEQKPPTAPSPEAPGEATAKPKRRWLRISLLIIGGLLVLAFIGIQLIPVNRTNPAATTPIKWDSPQTEALAKRACMDCHSNETVWPWYSYVAPASWLVYYDVARGRSEWNFSTVAAQGGRPAGFGVQQGDLAFQLGAMLAGERRGGFGGDRRGGDRPPGGQFPNGGQFPPNGGQGGQFPPREGGFGGEGGGLAGRVTEQIQNRTMPPANYTLIHPDAVLTDAERQQLIDGLKATLQAASQPAAQGN